LAQALSLSADERALLEAMVQRRRGPKLPLRSVEPAASSRVRGRTNLPAQLTSFVGRQREIVEVADLLRRARLLTLTGTGGCGKTRLALKVVGDLADAYLDGVWLVDLASLADPSLVVRAVASVFGVRDEPGQPLLDTLVVALGSRRLLLVLDNCEHLVGACVELVDRLVQDCSKLRILATSRQPLGVPGETVWRVPSLPVPAPEETVPIERYAAVQLFVERALAARPGFGLSRHNAPAVAEICRRVDGIPLAIELAAARVRVLSVEQIAQRLDDRFRFLTGGSRDGLPRQQTLRATLDWSYSLLGEPERALFRRLAIFVGSFNLDAVEAVGEGMGPPIPATTPWGWAELHALPHPNHTAPSVLDLLVELADKSLVQVEEEAGEARYRLLETLRQYGQEKLIAAGEADVARRRHRTWYGGLAARAEPELSGIRQREWLDRLEREHDNIRAAIEGCVGDPADVEEGLRLGAALLRFWFVRGHFGEGRYLLTRLLASAATNPAIQRSSARMNALHAAGFAAFWQGDYAAMRSFGEEWLVVARDLGDERGIWMANDMLARVYLNQGDYARARSIFVEQLAVMRRLGYTFGITSALVGLGVLERLQGEYERAVAFCTECLAVSREAGDVWFVGQALSNLGLARYEQGQYGVARKQFAEALALRRELGDRSGTAWSLINLGDVELAQGDFAAARARLEESLAILRDLGDRSGRADALASLGRVALAQRDFATARAHFVECLALRRDLGHRLAMPAILEDLATLAIAEVNPGRALFLAGAAESLRHALGAPASPSDREHIAQWLDAAKTQLGKVEAEKAMAEGRSMPIDQAIVYALDEGEGGVDEF
jgi:non-specific serine/threonine protein kinase